MISPAGAHLGRAEIIVTAEDVILTYGAHTVAVIPRRRFRLWLHQEREPLHVQGAGWHKDHEHDLELTIGFGIRVGLPVKLTADLYQHL